MRLWQIAWLAAGLVAGGGARWLWASSSDAAGRSAVHLPGLSKFAGLPSGGTGQTPSAPTQASAFAGARPTIDELVASDEFERVEWLARWLPEAQPADLEKLLVALLNAEQYPDTRTLDALFLRWTEIDPASARAAARRSELSSPMFWAWAKNDPDAALAAALEEADRWPGAQVVRAIGQSDPDRARQLLEKYPQFRRSDAIEGLASGMSKIDEHAAADLEVTTHTNDQILSWAQREPEAALAWARDVPDVTRRGELLRAMFERWQWSHPEKTAPAIEALPNNLTKLRLIAQHAARLAEQDVDAARDWALEASAPASPDAALGAMAAAVARDQPMRALELLRQVDWRSPPQSTHSAEWEWRRGETVHASGHGVDSTHEALARLAAVNPLETIDFLTRLPESSRAQQAFSAAVAGWINEDSVAASHWLAQQPSSPRKDTAISVLVNRLTSDVEPDFEAAVHWAAAMDTTRSTAVRDDRLRGIFQRWKRLDPEAAARGLHLPIVPETVREKLK